MANFNDSRSIELLAAEIGEGVYIDVAKWHLYLRDAHLHLPLAERFLPMIADEEATLDMVETVLKDIPVTLGNGKSKLKLNDLVPAQGCEDLVEILNNFRRNL